MAAGENRVFGIMVGAGVLVAAALVVFDVTGASRLHAKAAESGLQSVELSVEKMT